MNDSSFASERLRRSAQFPNLSHMRIRAIGWIAGLVSAFLLVGVVRAGDSALEVGETDAQGWTLIYEKDGVKAFRRSSDDSILHEFKGQAVIKANFHKVLAVYLDAARSSEWVSDCVESRVLPAFPPYDQITYNRTELPWPLKDRDFVYGERYTFDAKRGFFENKMKSVEHPAQAEVTDVVRGVLVSSGFIAQYIDENTTWVEMRVHTDPKGSIPTSVVNSVTRKWPYESMRDLRHRVLTVTGYDEREQAMRKRFPLTVQ